MRSWMIGLVMGFLIVAIVPSLPPPAIVCVLISFSLLTLRYNKMAMICLVSGLLAGIGAGSIYGYSVLHTRVTPHCESVAIVLEGVVVSLPRTSPAWNGGLRQQFEFRPSLIEPSHCKGPQRLLLSYYGDLVVRPGQQWRLGVKLKKPWGFANPGSFNIQEWYVQAKIDGIGNISKNKAVLLKEHHGMRLNYQLLRQNISLAVGRAGMDKPVTAILQALSVADKSHIDNALWHLFQQYGVNHILVISGLHISLSALVGYLLGGATAKVLTMFGVVRWTEYLPQVAALMIAFSYTALAGFSLAAVRALCMLACFVVASIAGRPGSPWNNLLVAGVIALLINPLSGVGSGFWLSFCAVGCLFWLGLSKISARLPLRLLHTHIFMSLVMIPLGGWWFGTVSYVSAVANFVMIPMVGLYVVPLCLLAILLYVLGLPWHDYAWKFAAWPIEVLLPLAEDLASADLLKLYTPLFPTLVGVVLALVALWLAVIPLPAPLKLFLPLMALPLFFHSETEADYWMKLTILDVGQGTAVILQSGDSTMVYDTGGGHRDGSNRANTVLLPYLRSQGITQIDTLMVSHADNDHSAGAETLLQAMPVRQVFSGDGRQGYPKERACRAGEAWQWPSGIRFQLLSPEVSPQGNVALSPNDSSCVLQVHIGDRRLLLPGDISAKREKELIRYWRETLRSNWLLAAHHGSLTSSSYAWLKAVQPGHVVYSHGYLNPFGHPQEDIVRRTTRLGSTVYSTAAGGALEVFFHRDRAEDVRTHRSYHLRYWL